MRERAPSGFWWTFGLCCLISAGRGHAEPLPTQTHFCSVESWEWSSAASTPRTDLGKLQEEFVAPLLVGPRVEERVPVGQPLTLDDLRLILTRREGALRLCYRDHRFHSPSTPETVRLLGEITPLGTVSVRQVSAATSDLGACVRKALDNLHLPAPSARRTLFDARILFRPSGFAPPTGHVRSPDRGPAGSAPLCLRVASTFPVDQRVQSEPLLVVDDYDQRQLWDEGREVRERYKKECRGPVLGTQQRVRARQPGLATLRWCIQAGPRWLLNETPPDVPATEARSVDPKAFRDYLGEALRANLGAYRACYADALKGHAGLGGWIVFSTQIDRAGNLRPHVKESSLSHQELVGCLQQAIERTWVFPWRHPIDKGALWFDYPLRLDPNLPESAPEALGSDELARLEAQAQKRLAQLDGTGAMQLYAGLLRRAPRHPRSCLWRLGELQALLASRPWLTLEPGAETAMQPLITALRAEPVSSQCRVQAEQTLYDFVTWPHKLGLRILTMPSLVELSLARYPLLLTLGPSWPKAYLMRYWYAEGLFKRGRYCEAAPLYQDVVADPDESKRKEAAYAAVVAWSYCLRPDVQWTETSLDPASWRRRLDVRMPVPLDRRYVRAVEEYIGASPDEEALARQGLIDMLVRHGQCSAARDELLILEQQSPGGAEIYRKWIDLQCGP